MRGERIYCIILLRELCSEWGSYCCLSTSNDSVQKTKEADYSQKTVVKVQQSQVTTGKTLNC